MKKVICKNNAVTGFAIRILSLPCKTLLHT